MTNHSSVSNTQKCSTCELREDCCVCHLTPQINLPFSLKILTHEKEIPRKTNTGKLAKLACNAEIITWSRTQDQTQLDIPPDTILLYPGEHETISNACLHDSNATQSHCTYLLLDGTWQETQKILNKSPFLKNLNRLSITPSYESRFLLRKNTRGLCTFEAVIEIIKIQNMLIEAKNLSVFFDQYLKHYKASDSGHGYKGDD